MSAEPKMEVVDNEAVPPMVEHFDRCKDWLQEALEGGFYTMDDVARAIAEKRAQFWPGKNAAIVTELDTLAQTRVIRVWLAGGDMDEVLSMASGIESWARLQGCKSVLIEGRKGWERTLKPQGYEPFSVILTKAL